MLTIDITRDEITPLLNELLQRLGDLSEPLTAVGAKLQSSISGRFETETDPNGAAWHPWAESTKASYPYAGSPAAQKSGRIGNGRILDRYGDMLQSLNYQMQGTNEVRIGFGSDYAVYHEFGTSRMPRRGLIFADPNAGELSRDDDQLILDTLYNHLDLN